MSKRTEDRSTETTRDRSTDTLEDVREMLTAEQVRARIPISRSTLFRLERDGVFPKGQAIAPHRKLWFKDEVVAWQKQLQEPNSALSQAIAIRARPRKLKAVV